MARCVNIGYYIWGDNNGSRQTAKLTTILRQIAGEGIEHSLGMPQFRHSSRLWIVVGGDLSMMGWQRVEGDGTELEMKDEEPLERSAGK